MSVYDNYKAPIWASEPSFQLPVPTKVSSANHTPGNQLVKAPKNKTIDVREVGPRNPRKLRFEEIEKVVYKEHEGTSLQFDFLDF